LQRINNKNHFVVLPQAVEYIPTGKYQKKIEKGEVQICQGIWAEVLLVSEERIVAYKYRDVQFNVILSLGDIV